MICDYQSTGQACYRLEAPEQVTPASCNNETNPCDPSTGNKSQREVDYAPAASGVPKLARFYNSKGVYKTGSGMPAGWRHTYSRALSEEPDRKPAAFVAASSADQSNVYYSVADACASGWGDVKASVWSGDLSTATASFVGGNTCRISSAGSTVAYFRVRSDAGWIGFTPPATIRTVIRPNGASYQFEQNGSDWISTFNPALKLEQSGSDWIFTDTSDTRETFDSSGKLISIAYRNGQTETLTYDLTAAQGGDDDSTTLDKVTGAFGHTISFAYDLNGQLISVTTPDGVITYGFDNSDNLSSVTYPDTTTRQYVYEDTEHPNHLTGIIDENGDRFATWDYDAAGRAILSERAGGRERVQLAYNGNGTTTLTTANGASRTYTFTTEQGQQKLADLTGDVCGQCPGGNTKDRTYDANGFLDEATDWEGNITKTARNGRGLTETLTEAKGTAEERVTTTVWHASYRLPTKITTPRNVTDYVYDTDGNPTSITISGGGKSRAWAFTYNAKGQPLTMDGPRADMSDITTLEYYVCTTGNECGQLKKVTNALGQITTYDSYDTSGRLTQMTDPNGLQTAFTYDSRGQVLTVTQTPTTGTARVTTMTYDAAGQLKTLTAPDGRMLTYSYDASHYLSSITDNFGNRVEYGYDAMGNLTDEDSYDPGSVLKRTMDYAYDLNNRLDTVTDGGFSTDLTLDLVGNLTGETDPNTNFTQYSYDALNRLEQTIDALSGITDYSYDAVGNLTNVTVPNGAATVYEYDDLGNLIREISPDRGTIVYGHDDAGNVTSRSDGRGVTATYTYDTLNRLLSVSYPNPAENVVYTYDTAANGIGRLAQVADQTGTTTYSYDTFGQVSSETRQISGISYVIGYEYDADGRVSSIDYPSGRSVNYGRDIIGNISQIFSDKDATTKTIANVTDYDPFGPPTSLAYGNSLTFDYQYLLDGSLLTYGTTALETRAYTYDVVGNVATIEETVNELHDQWFGYDALNRLVAEDDTVETYIARILADNPVAYWRLGEASGSTAIDASGNGHDGTYFESPTLGAPSLVGDTNTSMHTTHNTGYVSMPHLNGITVTAVEGWFQSELTGHNRDIITLFGSNSDRVLVYHHNDGHLKLYVEGTGFVIVSDTTVSSYEPHHFAVWYESGTNTTYMMIDGVVQQDTATGNPLAVGNPKVYLGAWASSSTVLDRFQGDLDELAIYADAKTAATFSNRSLPVGAPVSFTPTLAYDANGNRLSIDESGVVETYTYVPFSNLLATINNASVVHDMSGNLTADAGGVRTYEYNDANRLHRVLVNGLETARYAYNAYGQRTTKTVGSTTTVYLYDLFGNLLSEHLSDGTHVRDYVWIDGIPIAQVDAGERFSYLHFDHLGTPRLATDDSQTIVWRWDGDAFGITAADDDPDGDMNATTINLRFPGQYYDQETGLHYNYFRTYDPSTGRYLESDPIGLLGGLNTYGYVGGNPLSFIDPFGLAIYRFPGNVFTDKPATTAASSGCQQPIWVGGFIIGWMPCTYNENTSESGECPDDSKPEPQSSPLPPNLQPEVFAGTEGSSNTAANEYAQSVYDRCVSGLIADGVTSAGQLIIAETAALMLFRRMGGSKDATKVLGFELAAGNALLAPGYAAYGVAACKAKQMEALGL